MAARGSSRRSSAGAGRFSLEDWQPRTKVGRMVKEGKIRSIEEIFQRALPIDDVNIVNFLVPDLKEEVIQIRRVQRQTDAGRRRSFVATVAVGNENGLIGLGSGHAMTVGPAIRAALVKARINLVPVKRGCGSWECTCSDPHSVPFKVSGKCGSVKVELFPGPKGLDLVIGDVGKTILRLAGVKDVWSRTFGDTRTKFNFSGAVYDALKNTYKVVHPSEWNL